MPLPRFLALALVLSFPVSPVSHRVFYPTGKGAKCIAIGDLNHDGRPDIAVGNEDSTAAVLLNFGGSNFHPAPGSPFQAGHLPNDIVIADMNRDGHPDLVIVNTQSPYLTVLLGDGKGGFHP